MNLYIGRKGTQPSTFTGEQLQRGKTQWLLSQGVCSNPAYLECRSESQLGNGSGGWLLLQQLGGTLMPDGSENHRAKGRPCSISRADSNHHTINQNPLTTGFPSRGFPGGTSGKEPAWNSGDVRDMDLIPGLGRCPRGGHGNPLQYSCLENPMDRRAWQATDHKVAQSQTKAT